MVLAKMVKDFNIKKTWFNSLIQVNSTLWHIKVEINKSQENNKKTKLEKNNNTGKAFTNIHKTLARDRERGKQSHLV